MPSACDLKIFQLTHQSNNPETSGDPETASTSSKPLGAASLNNSAIESSDESKPASQPIISADLKDSAENVVFYACPLLIEQKFPRIPGSDLLGYGLEPCNGNGLCRTGDCTKKPILTWTYRKGRKFEKYLVPDQLTVLARRSTDATTSVWMTPQEEAASRAARASVAVGSFCEDGILGKSKAHVAERTVSVLLYSLSFDLSQIPISILNPLFFEELTLLPAKLSQGPHAYMSFIRRWGRYVVVKSSFGGQLSMRISYTGSGHGSASAQELGVTVERAFDVLCSSANFTAKAAPFSPKMKSVLARSEVSMRVVGGPPDFAIQTKDVVPFAPTAPLACKMVRPWIRGIKSYPRPINDVPTLLPLYKLLSYISNMSNTIWEAKRESLRKAHELFSVNPQNAINYDTRKCSNVPTSAWNEYDRLTYEQCLVFSAKFPTASSVQFASLPGDDTKIFRITMGARNVSLQQGLLPVGVWNFSKGSGIGVSSLNGDYWLCLTQENAEPGTCVARFGYNSDTVFSVAVSMQMAPRYFGFQCPQETSITNIAIHPFENWMAVLSAAGDCKVPGCVDFDKKACICKVCEEGLVVSGRGRYCEVDPICNLFSTFLTCQIQLRQR
jgi:hypothetical protein